MLHTADEFIDFTGVKGYFSINLSMNVINYCTENFGDRDWS